MRRYFARKLAIYVLTFFVAVTVDWVIPRFMPGDPVQGLLSRMGSRRTRRRRGALGFYTRPSAWTCPGGSST